MVPALSLVLFSGAGLSVELNRGVFVISLEGGWIKFSAASFQIAELLKELRLELERLLAEKIKDPSLDLLTHRSGKQIIATIVKVVSNE